MGWQFCGVQIPIACLHKTLSPSKNLAFSVIIVNKDRVASRRDLDATRQVAAIGSGSCTSAVRWSGCAQLSPCLRDLFKSFRPDIAIVDASTIHTWELTVCHESNFASSKLYKQNKHRLLGDDKTSFAGNRLVISHTMKVSTLGLASDTKDFTPLSCQMFRTHCGIQLLVRHCALLLASIVRETLVTILTNPRICNMSSV